MAEWTLATLLETEPQDFEKLLSELFSSMGYKTELTQYSRDKGVDIVISIENFGLTHTWLVQAKRYSGSVGVKEVREYSSLRYRDRVDGVIIVSTSSFTKEAMEEAAEHNVKLIDGNLLTGMLNYYLPDGNMNTISGSSPADEISDEIGNGTILKNGEHILASEDVILHNEKYILSITNKNIFLKKKSSGFFSNNSVIEERIEVKDIIGLHTEANRIMLVAGNKKLRMYPISSRKLAFLVEMFESLRPRYLKGEYLVISSRNGTVMTILTNKRLVVADISEGIRSDISNKKIVGVELKGGFLKKEHLIVSEDAGTIEKHLLHVDRPRIWKETIEQSVKTV